MFIVFCLAVFTINIIYFLLIGKFKFILSILYFVFNLIAIIVFSFVLENKKFVMKMRSILKVNLLIQIIIYILGMGKYYGAERYMGTFNDPNQYSYFVLLSLTFIYIINDKLEINTKDYPITIIAILLIIFSASTGMLLGLIILLLVKFLYEVNTKQIYKYITIILFFFIGIFLIFSDHIIYNTLEKYNDNFLIMRINDKLNRINNDSTVPTLLQERGYDKIIKNPQYILYGAGEGAYERFNGYCDIEIHATFPSLLFYYGIGPFFILVAWIYKKIKDNKIKNILFLVPLFIESFTLLNQRQALFWIIILFCDYYKEDKKNESIEENTKKF